MHDRRLKVTAKVRLGTSSRVGKLVQRINTQDLCFVLLYTCYTNADERRLKVTAKERFGTSSRVGKVR
jgi:hypothetical protein